MLVRFPSDESGRLRKLSRPWHGPFRVQNCNVTNIFATKVYFPFEEPAHVHQNRVKPCPDSSPPGFYRYGGRGRGPGHPPRWVKAVLAEGGVHKRTTQPPEPDSIKPDLLPSLFEDQLEETLPRGLSPPMTEHQDSPVELRGADATELTVSSSKDVQDSRDGHQDSPPLTGYCLRTTRCPPERYGSRNARAELS